MTWNRIQDACIVQFRNLFLSSSMSMVQRMQDRNRIGYRLQVPPLLLPLLFLLLLLLLRIGYRLGCTHVPGCKCRVGCMARLQDAWVRYRMQVVDSSPHSFLSGASERCRLLFLFLLFLFLLFLFLILSPSSGSYSPFLRSSSFLKLAFESHLTFPIDYMSPSELEQTFRYSNCPYWQKDSTCRHSRLHTDRCQSLLWIYKAKCGRKIHFLSPPHSRTGHLQRKFGPIK